MIIGDHQLDAAQPTPRELAQKIFPEGLRFGRADVHAQHLASAIGVHAHGDDHRDRHDRQACRVFT